MPDSSKTNPYVGLPDSRFWKTAVADSHPYDMADIYAPRFPLGRENRIAVAGSCFAQHVGNSLKRHGFNVLDTEPAPRRLEPEIARKYSYGIYSARYGNIYTVRQLIQLFRDCMSGTVREEDFWTRGDRHFDALRPGIEPDGFESLEEAMALRRQHLDCVKTLFDAADTLIFTLGLTEAWVNRQSGVVYPTCPGVIAGTFDDRKYAFVNFGFADVHADLVELRSLLLAIDPDMKLLFTVSPVPLTATASQNNVLVATCYSKSVLRAACGAMQEQFDNVDYFPSFEIITSPAARSFFYEPNLRSVNRHGVDHVMDVFMKSHGISAQDAGRHDPAADKQATPADDGADEDDDVVCEEALLDAFRR